MTADVPPGEGPVLEVRGLGKAFGATRALSSVSFSVARGEFVTLLGPSGCGKTTLLNLIGGFLEPDSGEIRLNGEVVNRIPPYRRPTAMVFQNYALFPHLDVFGNIAFGLRAQHVRRRAARQRVARIVEIVRLRDLLHRYPSQLSGGQQQRVALARALVVEPEVLLLDEPLSNLDAKLREGVRDELRVIQRQLGITAVLVTHDQDEAMAVSDRVMVMHTGRIEQIGTPRAIYERPQTAFVADFIGSFSAIEGEFVTVHPDGDVLQSAPELRIRLPHAPGRVPGLRGRVLIRPERLRLRDHVSPDGCALPGSVERVTFLGTHLRYVVQVGQVQFVVDDPRFEEKEYRPGDRVWVALPANPLFLPEEPG